MANFIAKFFNHSFGIFFNPGINYNQFSKLQVDLLRFFFPLLEQRGISYFGGFCFYKLMDKQHGLLGKWCRSRHRRLGTRLRNREKKLKVKQNLTEIIHRGGHLPGRMERHCASQLVLQKAGLFILWTLGGVPRGGGDSKKMEEWMGTEPAFLQHFNHRRSCCL